MKPTDKMIEAGAETLFNRRPSNNKGRTAQWSLQPDHIKDVFRADAEAALTSALVAAWQPIDANTLKDGSHILLGNDVYVDCGYWDAEGWTLYPDDTNPEDGYCVRFDPPPTHWQPLPEPPKETKG